MEDERDIVVFTDDEGNDLELEVLDYLFYNGEEYAVLSGVSDDECDCEHEDGCECDCEDCAEQELYIMKVQQLDDDMEEFIPVEDEEIMNQLIDIVQQRFEEEGDEEDENEDEE